MENRSQNQLIKLIRASKPVWERVESNDFPSRRATAILAERYRSLFRVTFCHFFLSFFLSLSLSFSARRSFSPPSLALKSRIKRWLCREKSYPRREIKRGSRHCGRRTRRAQSADNYDVQLALITDLFLIRGTGWNIADIIPSTRFECPFYIREPLIVDYLLPYLILWSIRFLSPPLSLSLSLSLQTTRRVRGYVFLFFVNFFSHFASRFTSYDVSFRSRARALIIWLQSRSTSLCTEQTRLIGYHRDAG